MKVPSGTPTTLATVSPVNISAMAPARFCGATRPAATTEPMPKKAPWAREATMRPVSIRPKTGAAAESRLPAMNRPISSISMRLRDTLVPSTVMTGAPATTPSAYPVTSSPAVGTVTPKSAATSGSRPMITNSVVPIPKAPMARARRARGMEVPFLGGVESAAPQLIPTGRVIARSALRASTLIAYAD